MIKVERSPMADILHREADGWLIQLNNATTKKQKKQAQNKYRHKQVKDALVAMFSGKCAYCESRIQHIAYGHIEHYRPKSIFPGLTFTWSNLLLACSKCNVIKGKRFPETNEGEPIINPCEDEPDDHLMFYFDPDAKLAMVYGKTSRGELTVELLELNRDDLRKHRSEYIKKLLVIEHLALTDTDTEARNILNEAVQDEAEYAAFARTLLRNIPH
ncbi:MAG: retron system putative HNH endonuclease [Candidatus Electryoneaceae bacterium]|nr:retron system putative HNH endonuclease [Candidatus Electryoneaceae bacterium]